jgi:hypothetical protein
VSDETTIPMPPPTTMPPPFEYNLTRAMGTHLRWAVLLGHRVEVVVEHRGAPAIAPLPVRECQLRTDGQGTKIVLIVGD